MWVGVWVSGSVDARWGCAGAGVRVCGCAGVRERGCWRGCWRGCECVCGFYFSKVQKIQQVQKDTVPKLLAEHRFQFLGWLEAPAFPPTLHAVMGEF